MSMLGERRPKKKFWETSESGYYKGGLYRPLMIACSSGCLELKLKGTRRVFRIPYSRAWARAIEIEVAAQQATRHNKKTRLISRKTIR